MPDDGKRAVQPKRNEWGYPDTYSADNYDDRHPGSATGEWPPPQVPNDYVGYTSLDAECRRAYLNANSALQPGTPINGSVLVGGSVDASKLDTLLTHAIFDPFDTSRFTDNVVESLGKADTALQGGSPLNGARILSASIPAGALAPNAVSTANVLNGAITEPKMGSKAIALDALTDAVREKLIVAKSAAIPNLATDADLPTTVAKVNVILGVLRAAGIIAT